MIKTTGFLRTFVYMLLFLLFTVTAAFGGTTDNIGRRYAILVGINHYLDNAILKLSTPRNDAADLGSALQSAGWDRVFVLHDELDYRHQDFPNRTNIENRVELLADLVSPDDTVFFFFSGHGVSDGTTSWILPVDASLNRLAETGIALSSVVSAFSSRGIENLVVAVDACREHFSLTKGLTVVGISDQAGADSAALALFSTRSGWYSYEDEKNGLFTRLLLEGIAGAADGSRGEADGVVTFADLAAWLPDASAAYALDRGLRQKAVAVQGLQGLDVLAVPVSSYNRLHDHSVPVVKEAAVQDTGTDILQNTQKTRSIPEQRTGFSFLQIGFAGSIQLFPRSYTIGGVAAGILGTHNTAVYGIQTAPFVSAEKLGGIQAAAFSSAETVWGFQVSIVSNRADTVYGTQVALFNKSSILYGGQFGLINNIGEINGVQCGIINRADSVQGVQLGLINSARSLRGIQLGIINRIKEPGLFGRFMIGCNIGF